MWSTIIGHRRQLEELRSSLASGRLPNAWLFAGPAGVGKRRVAEAFAAALVCDKVRDAQDEPCGGCGGCCKTAAALEPNHIKPLLSSEGGGVVKDIRTLHPDLFVVEPEAFGAGVIQGREGLKVVEPDGLSDALRRKQKLSETIRIDEVRALQAALQFHPLEARAKLAIFDETERMSESAANSLLKILEEPPTATHFILISARPGQLKATIRSRARRINFEPLADEEVAAVLVRRRGLERDEARRIARFAAGNLGTALGIDPDMIASTLGRFLALARGGSSADILQTAEEWSRGSAVEQRFVFDLLASFYRDCLRALVTGGAEGAIHPESASFAPRLAAGRLERALAEIEAGRRSLESTANKQLMFEQLLFTLTS